MSDVDRKAQQNKLSAAIQLSPLAARSVIATYSGARDASAGSRLAAIGATFTSSTEFAAHSVSALAAVGVHWGVAAHPTIGSRSGEKNR